MSTETVTGQRLWAILPAAGSGRRFGGTLPKQYLPLGGQTVLQCTLQRLQHSLDWVGGVLVLSAEDPHWPQLRLSLPTGWSTAEGGAERMDSVLAGLQALQGKALQTDWVLVHDVARPCVHPDSLQQLAAQLAQHPVGGILATPVRDTLKRAVGDDLAVPHIQTTIDRNGLWQAQTPQMFRYGLLRQALEQARANARMVTDEASAIEALGQPVALLHGRSDNLKITYAEDLPLAELIWTSQIATRPQGGSLEACKE